MIGIILKVFALANYLKGKAFAMGTFTSVFALIAAPIYSAAPMAFMEQYASQIVEAVSEQTGQQTETADSIPLSFEVDLADIGELISGARAAKPFQVTVEYIGQQLQVVTTGGTVGDILAQADIDLSDQDVINLYPDHQVCEEDRITITRQEILTEELTAEIPYHVEYIPTSLLKEGKERVLVEGQPGLAQEIYVQPVINGEEQQKSKLDEEILVQPVTQKVLVGQASHPVSEMDFGYGFDEMGEPVGYASVIRGQQAAGYSAKPGALTASGRPAMVGHVAVDPNVIPYGTKLYIKSTDGSFVYGYAIAADTGTFVHSSNVAVDLFYGSYLESCLNEIRNVDIFILEY